MAARRFPTLSADDLFRLAGLPGAVSMLRMPLPPLFRAMPFGCEPAADLSEGTKLLAAPWIFMVDLAVLGHCDAREIRDVVVERVAIDVMNDVTFRNLPMRGLPDFTVEGLFASSKLRRDARREVATQVLMGRVGPPRIDVTFKLDLLQLSMVLTH